MTRAIKLELDRTFEVFDLEPYPHLHDVLGAHFDITFLNGPIARHPRQVTVGIAVADEGLLKKLPRNTLATSRNTLATSLRGVFSLQDTMLVGPAVVVGSNWEGENVDVPTWAIDLVTEIKRCTDEAFKYEQNAGDN